MTLSRRGFLAGVGSLILASYVRAMVEVLPAGRPVIVVDIQATIEIGLRALRENLIPTIAVNQVRPSKCMNVIAYTREGEFLSENIDDENQGHTPIT